MHELLDKIIIDSPAELIYLFAGSVILYIFQSIKNKSIQIKKRRFIKKNIKRHERKKFEHRTIDIANADPYYKNENLLLKASSLFGQNRRLIIQVNKEYQNIIKENEKSFHYNETQKTIFLNDTSFDGSSSFNDLAQRTGIADLEELIAKHRDIVGEQFAKSVKGMLFNGKKFGIYHIKHTRFSAHEDPGANIELFETDYFTHRVFRSIYKEIKNRPCFQNLNNENFLKFAPFFTSFGINTFLITQGSSGNEIIFSKRSTMVNTDEPLYHVSMNEGLSLTDTDPFGRIDLKLCFLRGLDEELGIKEDIVANASMIAFYDFFLDTENLEMGLTSMIKLDIPFSPDIANLIGRDKHLESSSFVAVKLQKKAIVQFLDSHKMMPYGKYVLQRVLLRENISLD